MHHKVTTLLYSLLFVGIVLSGCNQNLDTDKLLSSSSPETISSMSNSKLNVEDLESKISSRISSLRFYALYDFNSPSELTPQCIAEYIRGVCNEYPFAQSVFDKADKSQIGAYLNYEQVMQIVEKEFGLNELPFEIDNKESICLSVMPSDSPEIRIQSIQQKDDIITVITDAPYERIFDMWNNPYTYDKDSNDWMMAAGLDVKIEVSMEYKFKIVDGTPMLLSGKRLA